MADERRLPRQRLQSLRGIEPPACESERDSVQHGGRNGEEAIEVHSLWLSLSSSSGT